MTRDEANDLYHETPVTVRVTCPRSGHSATGVCRKIEILPGYWPMCRVELSAPWSTDLFHPKHG